MAEKVQISTILLKVNLECYHSNIKIRMILWMLQEREKIQTIEYDEKKNTVKVSGPFDPHLLSKKLLCLACDVIMGIEILPPPPPPPSDPPKPKPPTPLPLPLPTPTPCPWPPNVLCPYPPWQCPPPPQCPWPPNVKCPYPEWPGCSRQPCPCSEHQGGRGGHRCCSCRKTDSGGCPPPSCRHCGGAGGCSWCARPSCVCSGGAGGCSRCAGAGCKIVFEGDSPYDCATM